MKTATPTLTTIMHHMLARLRRALLPPQAAMLATRYSLLATFLVLAFPATTARADKIFGVNIEPYSSPPPTLSVQSNSLPNLLKQVISSVDTFAVYRNVDFKGSITYLGVPNTLIVDMVGPRATISIPCIGFTKVFDATTASPGTTAIPGVSTILGPGATREDTYDLVKDYFKKDGLDIYGRLMKEMASTSAVAITDGNPSALTARMANNTFVNDGFTPVPELVDALDATDPAAIMGAAEGAAHRNFTGLGIGLNSGWFKAADFRGSYTDMTAPLRHKFSNMLSLAGTFSVNYLNIEGSKVYGFGLGLSLPVRLRIMSKENPWNWRITPTIGLSARGSSDMACGALIFTTGITNTVDYRVNSKLIIGMVNHAGFFTSTTTGLPQDFKYDPRVQQLLLKNGFRAVTPLDAAKRFILDGFIIETNFTKAATVRGYTTLGSSLQWKATRKNYITFGANYDFGKDYTSWSLGLSSVWQF